jgi:hypothetical protein
VHESVLALKELIFEPAPPTWTTASTWVATLTPVFEYPLPWQSEQGPLCPSWMCSPVAGGLPWQEVHVIGAPVHAGAAVVLPPEKSPWQ